MKKIFIISQSLVLCLVLNFQTTYSSIPSRISKITIFEDDQAYRNTGFNIMSMEKNGELNLLQNTIYPCDIVFDVGASRGEWSEHVLNSVSSVYIYAFEPIKTSFELLKTTLGNKISAYNIALSNITGIRDFMVYQGSLANNQLSTFYERPILKYQYHFEHKLTKVKCSTLDLFCSKNNIDHIDFLKIDTEGAEYEILVGAEELLSFNAIKIIQFEYGGCFLDAKTTLKDTLSLLNKYHYRLFRIIPEGLLHIHSWYPALENYIYSNYVAVCPDQAEDFCLIEGL